LQEVFLKINNSNTRVFPGKQAAGGGETLSIKNACSFRRRHGTMTSGSFFEKNLPKSQKKQKKHKTGVKP